MNAKDNLHLLGAHADRLCPSSENVFRIFTMVFSYMLQPIFST